MRAKLSSMLRRIEAISSDMLPELSITNSTSTCLSRPAEASVDCIAQAASSFTTWIGGVPASCVVAGRVSSHAPPSHGASDASQPSSKSSKSSKSSSRTSRRRAGRPFTPGTLARGRAADQASSA